jgi:hypothetical protein
MKERFAFLAQTIRDSRNGEERANQEVAEDRRDVPATFFRTAEWKTPPQTRDIFIGGLRGHFYRGATEKLPRIDSVSGGPIDWIE